MTSPRRLGSNPLHYTQLPPPQQNNKVSVRKFRAGPHWDKMISSFFGYSEWHCLNIEISLITPLHVEMWNCRKHLGLMSNNFWTPSISWEAFDNVEANHGYYQQQKLNKIEFAASLLSWITTNFMGYCPLVAQCLPLADLHHSFLTKKFPKTHSAI